MALALGARMIEGSNPFYPRLLNITNAEEAVGTVASFNGKTFDF